MNDVLERTWKVLDGPWLEARLSHYRGLVLSLGATMCWTYRHRRYCVLLGRVCHTWSTDVHRALESSAVKLHVKTTDENSFDLDSVRVAISSG